MPDGECRVKRLFLRKLHEQHIEELSMLYERRLDMLDDAEIEVEDLLQVEDRIEAHLDALVVGADAAVELCVERAADGDMGERFGAIAVLCRQQRPDLVEAALPSFEDGDQEAEPEADDDPELAALPGLADLAALAALSPEAVVEDEDTEPDEESAEPGSDDDAPEAEASAVADDDPTVAGALTDALRFEALAGWQPLFERLLAGSSPVVCTAIAMTAGSRGLPLGSAIAAAAERLAAGARLETFSWALGRLRERSAVPFLSRQAQRLDSPEAAVATLSLLRFGDPSVLDYVVRLVPKHPWACSLLAIAGGPALASILQGRLARTRVAAEELIAVGLFGDVGVVPQLLECLEKGLHPEAAAQALYLLTGAHVLEKVVEGSEEPERLANGEPDPRDRVEIVKLGQNPAAWWSWWDGHRSAFQLGWRYRLGQLASPVVLGHTLHRFVLPRSVRQLAAEEIGVRYQPRQDLDVNMRVRSQHAALTELSALQQNDAIISRADGAWVFARALMR